MVGGRLSGVIRRGRVERIEGGAIGLASYALTQHARRVSADGESAIVRAVRIDVDARGAPLVSLARVQLGQATPRPLWDVPISDANAQ